jgi:nucleotide-binding universal stress UspA family protein
MMARTRSDRFTILLGDDSSEHASAARALVADLPLPAGSNVTLLRAFASTQAGELSPLEDSLDQSCAQLNARGFQARSELLLGTPAEKIVEYAEQHRPDLIVMGARGLRATLGILLGGVAQQVVEYACCPVLVVRAPYKGLERILLVTDGSPSSRQAVEYLGGFPLPGRVKIQVLHVLPPPPMKMIIPDVTYDNLAAASPAYESDSLAALSQKEQADGQDLLDRTIASLQGDGLLAEGLLRRGDAATEIIDHVKQQDVDLIVTGSRGLSRIRSWMMGSVSRKLVHYSGCSVLVVRGHQPD